MSFSINKKLYLTNYYETGLNIYDNDSLKQVKGGYNFIERDIFFMLPYSDNQILVGDVENGLFIYDTTKGNFISLADDQSFKKFNSIFIDSRIYHGIALSGNNYAFATLNDGLIISNRKGKILEWFNTYHGLPIETVTYLYNPERSNNQLLWLGLYNGISSIEVNSPIRKMDKKTGIKGMVNDVIRFNGILYAATINGIYYLDKDENNLALFKLLDNKNNAAWEFEIIDIIDEETHVITDQKLLASYFNTILEIKNNNCQPITDFAQSYVIYQSQIDKSLIYIGCSDCLLILTYKQDKWSKVNILRTDDEIRTIIEDKKGNLWLATLLKGLIKIENSDFSNKTIIYNEPNKNGLPETIKNIRLYKVEDEILFTTAMGIYRFDYTNETFYPDTSFGKKYADRSTAIQNFEVDKNGKYWINCSNLTKEKKGWIETVSKQNDGSYKIDTIQYKRFPKVNINDFYHDIDNITWISTVDGLYSYNNSYQKNYHIKYNALIRKVVIGEDSTIFHGSFYTIKLIDNHAKKKICLQQPSELKPVLLFSDNSITFHYSAAYYEVPGEIKYSTYLDGFDKQNKWSKWTNKTERAFTNLDAGKYTFMVKAKNVYDIESDSAQYEFEILPPWWKTWWFITLELIIAILITGLVFQIFNKVKIRKIENKNRIKNELFKSRQQALSAQMNPHFIFNSLNSIQFFIINNDKDKSNLYLTKFASLMRKVLDNSQQSLITIEEELEALTLYIELESLRFPDKFSYSIDIDKKINLLKYKIPPLLLQPYVENAILHGLMNKKDGNGKLEIIMKKDDNTLKCSIKDNGVGRKKSREIKSQKLGIYKSVGTKITKKRMHIINSLYNSQMDVIYIDLFDEYNEAAGTQVEITLPILL